MVLRNTNITKDLKEDLSTPIVMSLSPDCNILSTTNNAAELYGKDISSLYDQNLFDFINFEDILKCEKLIDSISEGVTLEVDLRIGVKKDSDNNRVVVFQLPNKYSKVINEIIWITIPKVSEEVLDSDLKSSKKHNFAIIEDNDNYFLNNELSKLLSVDSDSKASDIIFNYNRRKIDFANILSTLEEGEVLTEDLYLKNKSNRYLSFTGSFIKHSSELKDSLIVILREKMISSNQFLEYNSSDIYELNEKIKNRDKFFSIIAHDLRSPFTAILGYSEYMASYYESLTRDEIHDFSNNMYKASKSVFKLLEDLLKWTRIQSGKITVDKEIFSLASTLERAVDMFRTLAEKKNIRLLYNSPQNEVLLNADEGMISSIFRNLISNAIKFTEANGFVKIDVKVENDYATVSVIDNGIGIDNGTLSRLFKLGERVTRYGTSDEEGSGLGLILSKEFIVKNNGDIWVESNVGEGTKFYVKLPIKNFE